MTGSLQVKRGIYYMTVSFKDEKGVCRQKSKSTGIPETVSYTHLDVYKRQLQCHRPLGHWHRATKGAGANCGIGSLRQCSERGFLAPSVCK